ncbi:hypothetical protein KEM54_003439 [Ascosphaera aggregata]|nr:hypothetical protein KEM54_003439 [Ascosphaera aggregata]
MVSGIDPPVAAEAAITIYCTHFSGKVHTLVLSKTNEKYTLTEKTALEIPGRPSWLTWDDQTRILYVSDEELNKKEGVLSVLQAADPEGDLNVKTSVSIPWAAVASTLYGGQNGNSFIANAHYSAATVTSYALPVDPASTPLSKFEYSLSQAGANPERQEAPHPHHILTDPLGIFIIVPDLGADLVRVYGINKRTGVLSELPPIEAAIKGNGPRHAIFWKSAPSSLEEGKRLHEGTWLYVANELANTVDVYAVTYDEGEGGDLKPSFSLKQTISTYGDIPAPSTSTLAAIKVKDNDMYVSNRHDQAFKPHDSLTHFSIDPSNGLLTFKELSPTYGANPRAFEISPLGDLVAITNKTTDDLAIVKRDPVTGTLGERVAAAKVGGGSGLSAIVFV